MIINYFAVYFFRRYFAEPTATGTDRNLTTMEWEILRQAMGVLDLLHHATTSVQGGSGGLLAQATFTMMELREVLDMEDQEIYPKVMNGI